MEIAFGLDMPLKTGLNARLSPVSAPLTRPSADQDAKRKIRATLTARAAVAVWEACKSRYAVTTNSATMRAETDTQRKIREAFGHSKADLTRHA